MAKNRFVVTPPAGPVWFVADTHFFHEGAIHQTKRPFRDVAEMNALMIEAWNATVRKTDTVYHLGDFAMKASAEQCQQAFAALNGRKNLLRGNHDHDRTLDLPWESIHERLTVIVDERRLVLDHYPLRAWDRSFRDAIHLHGHTHGSLPGTSQSCDVGVDCWQYRPVALPEILARLAATEEEPEERRRARERHEAERADAE